jgi:hypothetical protein
MALRTRAEASHPLTRITPQFSGRALPCDAPRQRLGITVRCNCLLAPGNLHFASARFLLRHADKAAFNNRSNPGFSMSLGLRSCT